MNTPTYTSFPTLHTERLTLRQLTAEDENAFFFIRSDKELNKYIDIHLHETVAESRAFIEKLNKDGALYWAIALRENPQQLIGTVCTWSPTGDLTKNDVGYALHPDAQGKGYMREALSAVITFGFEKLNLNTIEAYTNGQNKASTGLLERLNFVKTGHDPESPAFVIYGLKRT